MRVDFHPRALAELQAAAELEGALVTLTRGGTVGTTRFGGIGAFD
jgi:hypothetical protein